VGYNPGDVMETVASYIIRIYRCEKDRPKSLVGVVSEAGRNEKKVFQSYDELWEILNAGKEKGGRRREVKAPNVSVF
jgi:hypothetical protein